MAASATGGFLVCGRQHCFSGQRAADEASRLSEGANRAPWHRHDVHHNFRAANRLCRTGPHPAPATRHRAGKSRRAARGGATFATAVGRRVQSSVDQRAARHAYPQQHRRCQLAHRQQGCDADVPGRPCFLARIQGGPAEFTRQDSRGISTSPSPPVASSSARCMSLRPSPSWALPPTTRSGACRWRP